MDMYCTSIVFERGRRAVLPDVGGVGKSVGLRAGVERASEAASPATRRAARARRRAHAASVRSSGRRHLFRLGLCLCTHLRLQLQRRFEFPTAAQTRQPAKRREWNAPHYVQ